MLIIAQVPRTCLLGKFPNLVQYTRMPRWVHEPIAINPCSSIYKTGRQATQMNNSKQITNTFQYNNLQKIFTTLFFLSMSILYSIFVKKKNNRKISFDAIIPILSGGHFGAMEEPELLAEDILSFAGITITIGIAITITAIIIPIITFVVINIDMIKSHIVS